MSTNKKWIINIITILPITLAPDEVLNEEMHDNKSLSTFVFNLPAIFFINWLTIPVFFTFYSNKSNIFIL